MEVRAKLGGFLADFAELSVDTIKLGHDGHEARDQGREDGKERAFAGRDGLESMGGDVTGKAYWFGFRVSFDTQDVLCLVL